MGMGRVLRNKNVGDIVMGQGKIYGYDTGVYIDFGTDGKIILTADSAVEIPGNLTVEGNFTFGDAAADTFTVTGKLDADGDVDLGSGDDTINIGSGGGDTVNLKEDITIADGKNIVVNTTTGTQIGTGATQKLGFFGATPVAQPSSTGQTSGFTAGSGNAVNDDSTFTGGVGSTAYTIGDIVKHLKTLGLIAS